MPSSKKSTKKASSPGGVSAQAIQRVLREAKPVEDTGARAAAAAAPAAIPNFCAQWKSRIRPLMLAAIGILKIFRPKAAEALAAAVAFIDGICGGEE